MIDRNAGVINRLVHHAERIGLRRPLEIVDGAGPIALSAGVDFIDRDDFAWLRLGQEFLVVETPPRRGVAAERLAGVFWVGRRPRLNIYDAYFKNVAWLGAAHIDRAGADMHAQALASAAAKELAVDRAGASAIDAFFLLGPEIDAFGTRVAFDHAFGIVIGMMRQCLDRHVVARIHLDLRLEQLAEITPVHRLCSGREIVVAGLALPGRGCLRRRRSDHRRAAGGERRRTAGRGECALEETAALVIEIGQQLLAMQVKLRAGTVVTLAHDASPRCMNPGSPDDSRKALNIRVFPAFLQDGPEVRTATGVDRRGVRTPIGAANLLPMTWPLRWPI